MRSLENLTNDELQSLGTLMSTVWHSTYDPIVGNEHSEMLLHKYFDYQNILIFKGQGYVYKFIKNDDACAGLVVYVDRGNDIYLDKLYVFENQRRRGLASYALTQLKQLGKDVRLNVNRGNTNAIRTYEKNGFCVEKVEDIQLPGGFVNQDFVMLCEANNTTATHNSYRRLERSPNKTIAGVCAGIAEYFDFEVTVVRVIYLLLTVFTMFSGVVIYIILWILMPPKRTL